MGILNPNPNNKSRRDLGQLSLLASVPTILIAGPLVGFFVGQWLDKKLGSEPYLMILGLILGFVAAGVEIYNLVKKSESLGKEKDDNEV